MADLVQVPADVRVEGVCAIEFVKSGAALAQGQLVYHDNGLYLPARADTEAHAKAVGMALTPATAIDKYFVLVKSGTIYPGDDLEPGKTYVVSNTVGGGFIAPIDDVATGWWTTIIGIAKSATELPISFLYSPAAVP